MAHFVILGGGLAGLAAAAALGGEGHEVTVLEAKPYLGGRATSFPVQGATGEEVIDNCQHILLRCCVNLMDFYRRLGVADRVHFHKEFYFIEPGGRTSVMKAGWLPKPLHFTESFATLKFLDIRDKIAVAQGLLAIQSERLKRTDLDQITMLDWLREKRQTPKAIDRFWRQVLVSAINEDLEKMAASHGFQVFWLGFLAKSYTYEMGIPAAPLGELYGADLWRGLPSVRLRMRTSVDRIRVEDGRVAAFESSGESITGDTYISSLPFERLAPLAPDLGISYASFQHSPITGIHLWFDRPVTNLPHGTLLDRTIQWFFNKADGKYLQLVVSASRSMVEMSRADVISLAVRELQEFLPEVGQAALVKAHVIKEVRATFSAQPGLEQLRPAPQTRWPNFFLAGDWTRSGWPATMEGAVRSGYHAADAALGKPGRFLLPDIA